MRKGLLAAAWRQAPELVQEFQDQLRGWLTNSLGLSRQQIDALESLSVPTGAGGLETTNPALGEWLSNLQQALLHKAAVEAIADPEVAYAPEVLLEAAYGESTALDWNKVADALDQWRLYKALFRVTGSAVTNLSALIPEQKERIDQRLEQMPLSSAQEEMQKLLERFQAKALQRLYPTATQRAVVTTLADADIPADQVLRRIKGILERLRIEPGISAADRQEASTLLEKLAQAEEPPTAAAPAARRPRGLRSGA